MNIVRVLVVGAFLVTVAGCGGGGSRAVFVNRSTTLGQELSDLQGAYQKGVLTEEEYTDQRARLLRGEAGK